MRDPLGIIKRPDELKDPIGILNPEEKKQPKIDSKGLNTQKQVVKPQYERYEEPATNKLASGLYNTVGQEQPGNYDISMGGSSTITSPEVETLDNKGNKMNLKDRWKSGQLTVKRGQVGMRALATNADIDQLKQDVEIIDNEMLELSKTAPTGDWADPTTYGPYLISRSAELLPYMGKGMVEGMKTGLQFGLSAASAAILGGQLGPQALTPEEIITAPTAFAMAYTPGAAYGAMKNALDVEGGNLYIDMLQRGVDKEKAKPLAIAGGLATAAIEVAQIGRIAKRLPGFDKFSGKAVNKLVNSPTFKKLTRNAVLQYAEDIGWEVTEETAQEIIQVATEATGALMSEDAENITLTEAKQRIWDVVKQSAAGMALLPLPGNVAQAYGARKLNKQQETSVSKIGDIIKATEQKKVNLEKQAKEVVEKAAQEREEARKQAFEPGEDPLGILKPEEIQKPHQEKQSKLEQQNIEDTEIKNIGKETSDKVYKMIGSSFATEGTPKLGLYKKDKLIGAILLDEDMLPYEHRFDIVVKKGDRGKGYSDKLIKKAIENFVNDEEADTMSVEVANQKLLDNLMNKYGFEYWAVEDSEYARLDKKGAQKYLSSLEEKPAGRTLKTVRKEIQVAKAAGEILKDDHKLIVELKQLQDRSDRKAGPTRRAADQEQGPRAYKYQKELSEKQNERLNNMKSLGATDEDLTEIAEEMKTAALAKIDDVTGAKTPLAVRHLKDPNDAKNIVAEQLFFDVDNFKEQDKYVGFHAAGDKVLAAIGSLAKRQGLNIVRWGGDEFIILIGDQQFDDVVEKFKKVQAELKKMKFDKHIETGQPWTNITLSAGVGKDTRTADKNLKKAKETGKDKIALDLTDKKTHIVNKGAQDEIRTRGISNKERKTDTQQKAPGRPAQTKKTETQTKVKPPSDNWSVTESTDPEEPILTYKDEKAVINDSGTGIDRYEVIDKDGYLVGTYGTLEAADADTKEYLNAKDNLDFHFSENDIETAERLRIIPEATKVITGALTMKQYEGIQDKVMNEHLTQFSDRYLTGKGLKIEHPMMYHKRGPRTKPVKNINGAALANLYNKVRGKMPTYKQSIIFDFLKGDLDQKKIGSYKKRWAGKKFTQRQSSGLWRLMSSGKYTIDQWARAMAFLDGEKFNQYIVDRGDGIAAGGMMHTREPAPKFYSISKMAIVKGMGRKADAGQIKGLLKNAGIPKEELEHLDLDTYLKDNPNPTKKELLQYIDSKELKLNTIIKTGKVVGYENISDLPSARRLNEIYGWTVEIGPERDILAFSDPEYGDFYDYDDVVFMKQNDELEDPEILEYVEDIQHAWNTGEWREMTSDSELMHPGYQLPGGEDYKEILITYDPKKGVKIIYPAKEKIKDEVAKLSDKKKRLYNNIIKPNDATEFNLAHILQNNPEITADEFIDGGIAILASEITWNNYDKYETLLIDIYTNKLVEWRKDNSIETDALSADDIRSEYSQGKIELTEDQDNWLMAYGEQWDAIETKVDEFRQVSEAFDDEVEIEPGVDWTHSHWKEKNVLVHARINTRIGPNGERILFIEEIQSDWHATGREHGYRKPGQTQKIQAEDIYVEELTREQAVNLISESGVKDMEKTRRENRIPKNKPFYKYGVKGFEGYTVAWKKPDTKKLAKEADPTKDLLERNTIDTAAYRMKFQAPDAPFKNTWDELIMKELLRQAADGNYDAIAWTTAKQQIDRWQDNIRQNVDIIKWEQEEPGWVMIEADKDGRQVFRERIPKEGTINLATQDVTLNTLLGKSMADQIRESEDKGGEFKGDDLTIGGEKFKIIYDKAIPGFLNKYFKKYGEQTGEITISKTTLTEETRYQVLNTAARDIKNVWKELGTKDEAPEGMTTIVSVLIENPEQITKQGQKKFAKWMMQNVEDGYTLPEYQKETLKLIAEGKDTKKKIIEHETRQPFIKLTQQAKDDLIYHGQPTFGMQADSIQFDTDKKPEFYKVQGTQTVEDIYGQDHQVEDKHQYTKLAMKGGKSLYRDGDSFIAYDKDFKKLDKKKLGDGEIFAGGMNHNSISGEEIKQMNLPGAEKGAWDNYERVKNIWFQEEDEGLFRAMVEKSTLQREIKEALGKKKYDKQAQDIDMAIQIYIDSKRAGDEDLKGFLGRLTEEQRRIYDISQNLPPKIKAIADKIEQSYKEIGQQAKDREVIRNTMDHYVSRVWDLETKQGTGTEKNRRFGTTTRHAKHRKFRTIVEGWANDYELKIKGATNNLHILKEELTKTMADKLFIKSLQQLKTLDGAPLLTDKNLPGYVKVNHPNFRLWKWAGQVSKAELEGDPLKVFDRNFFIDSESNLYSKKELYAPKKIAGELNRMLGISLLKQVPSEKFQTVIKTIDKYNATLKSWILLSSLFHPMAFARSYYLGTNHKKFSEMNVMTAYKEGEKMVQDLNPVIVLGVRNGLTLGLKQDWDEELAQEGTIIGKMMDKLDATKAVKEKIMELRKAQADWLFGVMGTGLKAKAFAIEYANRMKKDPTANPDEIAKQVANLINDDFGGLHLKRLDRDPTIQHLFRMFCLAPDWTESNVRTMIKIIKKGGKGEREMYQKFWAGIITKGIILITLGNLLLNPDPEDQKDAYKKAWKEGHFRWLDVDITNLYKLLGGKSKERYYFSPFGHFKDPMKFITHPVRSMKHKGSVLFNMLFDFLTGTDWAGRKFTSFDEFLKDHTTVTWNRGGKGPVEYSQLPSFIMSKIKGSQPVQIQNLIAWNMGEIGGFEALGRSLGFRVATTHNYKRTGKRKL